jgi:hypothetical protein
MPGPTRRDAALWGIAFAVGAVLTLIALAAGARLGAALTAGVIGLVATMVAGLLVESRRPSSSD